MEGITSSQAVLEVFVSVTKLEAINTDFINGKPNNCEVKLKPTTLSKTAEFCELWVKSPSFGQFLNPIDVDSEGFFNTGDLAKITADLGIQVLNRSGQLIKNQKGIWVSLDSVQENVQQQLQIEHLWVCRQGHEFYVAITPQDENNSNFVKDYLTHQLGTDVKILIIEKSILLKILSDSSKKSGRDAVSEWISNYNLRSANQEGLNNV